MKTRSPLIWFGGKSKVANEIINRMPDHKVYVEPFGGAAHVIAQKPPAEFEIYNDIDGELINFMMVARSKPEELARACETIPYSRQLYIEWRDSEWPADSFDRAVRYFYVNRSGIAKGNGPAAGKTGWRHHHSHNVAKTYHSAIQLFESFAERMKYVQIDNRDFRKVIEVYDTPNTLFYVDPPYIGKEKHYAGQFSDQDHRDLAEILNNIKGKAIVSYYDDSLLEQLYTSWRRETFSAVRQVVNGANCKSEELLLMNFDLQPSLFDWENAL